MPGGRVQPVVLQRAPEKKHAEASRLSQLEDMRKRTIAAQQALAASSAQLDNDRRLEQKMKDDDVLRRQHEAKLNETAGDEPGRQQDADEELKRFQAAGLLAERQRHHELEVAADLKREQDALVEHARQAALDEKTSEPVPVSVPVPIVADSVPAVVPLPLVVPDLAPVNADAELLQIRARISDVLNEDVTLPA